MNKLKLLREILDKFKVSGPLPEEIKPRMLKAKKAVLINILKEHKHYSFWIFLIISVYFYTRWLGIGISLAKSSAIVIISALTTAAVISAGSYYAITQISFDKPESRIEEIEKSVPEKEELSEPVKKESAKKTNIISIDYKLDIIPFTHDTRAKKAAKILARNIKINLIKIKGKSAARILYGPLKNARAAKLLSGSIVMVDDIYMVSAKITNPKTSQVLMFINEETRSEAELNKIAKKIARTVAAKL